MTKPTVSKHWSMIIFPLTSRQTS